MTQTKRVGLETIASGWGLTLSPDALDAIDVYVVEALSRDIKTPVLSGLPVPIGREGDIVADRFEYERLGPKSRAILHEQEARLDEVERRSAIDKGGILNAIKAAIVDDIGHGNWLAWLAARGIPETTARCWMRAADWVAESAIVAGMDLGAIYRGARAATEVKAEIVRRLKAGEPVDLDLVVSLIKVHKNAMRVARADPAKANRPLERTQEREADTQIAPIGVTVENAKKAAEDVVEMLRVFFDDDEISILNARWREATSAEIECLLHKRRAGSMP